MMLSFFDKERKKNFYTDINECVNNNAGCDHDCINEHGSYKCVCKKGFSLTADGYSCEGTKCTLSTLSQLKICSF